MQKQKKWSVIIVGGGLAGLTAAIHLSKLGVEILLIDKEELPKHKVCGEYVSNEVLSYLNSIGFDPFQYGAVPIEHLQVVLSSGKTINNKMKLGGFGLSRYTMDYALLSIALAQGVTLVNQQVEDIQFTEGAFKVITKDDSVYLAQQVLGAYGKRSVLDKNLKRDFFEQTSPFLAVKTHRRGEFPADMVGLFNFEGGYCGISTVENDIINSCYIVSYKSFKAYKNPAQFESEVMYANPTLKDVLSQLTPIYDKPLTISQISFKDKPSVENGVLFMGDAAGLIHPLCGNGMSMAIESARIASILTYKFLKTKINRETLQRRYKIEWNETFNNRIKTGRAVSRLMQSKQMSSLAFKGIKMAPFVLNALIKRSHGQIVKPFGQ